QGHAALVLLRLEVACGRPVLDPPSPGHRAGREEQRLGERRLPDPVVPDEGDIADSLRRVPLHQAPLPLTSGRRIPRSARACPSPPRHLATPRQRLVAFTFAST